MKARIKFSKTGSMRFIGHLDVMRYFQKAFRRADIHMSYSQGFSPHQLMSFTSPLGIGLSSDAEYLDIVLEDSDASDVMVERINEVMNDEIRVLGFTKLNEETKPSMSVLAACDYMIAVKPERESVFSEGILTNDLLDKFLSREHIEIIKKTKRSEKLVDIKENIYHAATDMKTFSSLTGKDYGELSIDTDYYKPVLYCQLTAGSIVNIKPELLMEAICYYMDVPFDILDFQIHRMEMYADASGKKGEIHTLTSETPCRLVSMSEYGKAN